ncbi:formate--tetrahydrofolate ligase, partial [Agathobacter rectalis]|uniref:formate--tetrahydrofolate ligase n=2 Tax=Bacillota TaxID=1239 RepID=UPI0027D2C8A5
DLAKEVVKLADQPSNFHELYDVEGDSIEDKVNTIAKTIYGAKDVEFSKKAQKQLKKFHEMGWENMPVCIAKTQYS